MFRGALAIYISGWHSSIWSYNNHAGYWPNKWYPIAMRLEHNFDTQRCTWGDTTILSFDSISWGRWSTGWSVGPNVKSCNATCFAIRPETSTKISWTRPMCIVLSLGRWKTTWLKKCTLSPSRVTNVAPKQYWSVGPRASGCIREHNVFFNSIRWTVIFLLSESPMTWLEPMHCID